MTAHVRRPRTGQVAVLFCSLLLCAWDSTPAAQHFSVDANGVMLDPSGRPFISTGVSMIGRNPSQQTLDKYINSWKFNTVRVWWHYVEQFYPLTTAYAMVEPFTSRNVVVLLDLVHDPIGSYRDGSMLAGVKEHWKTIALRYKDNPYVWFELLNEPGGMVTDQPRLLAVYQELIKVIRDDVGAQNPIVCEAASWGQDLSSWGSTLPEDSKSFILTSGKSCMTFNGKTYPNIVMAFHTYDQWNAGGDTKMSLYLDKVALKKLCLFNTETGSYNNNSSTMPATKSFFHLYRSYRNVCGWSVWNWDNQDAGDLTTNGANGSGEAINSATNPSNLTELGNLCFQEAHAVAAIPTGIQTSPNPALNRQGDTGRSSQRTALFSIRGQRIVDGIARTAGAGVYLAGHCGRTGSSVPILLQK